MDQIPLLSLITMFVVFLSVFFAFFLFTVKTEKRLSNILIGLFFLTIAVNISVFFYKYYIEDFSPSLNLLRDQVSYLSNPLLYLYILSAIYNDFRLRPIHLLHVLPFIIVILVFYPNFYGIDVEQQKLFSDNFQNRPESRFSFIFGYVHAGFYLTLMFMALRRYKKVLLENYSNSDTFNYKWLLQLTVLMTVLYFFSLFKLIFKSLSDDSVQLNNVRIAMVVLLLGFISWIVFKSMNNPELFRGIASHLTLVRNMDAEKSGHQKMGSSPKYGEDINGLTNSLKKHMVQTEPYLDPALTVQDLADQLNIPSRELSILVNRNLGLHFFDFVNGYRIEKAMRILKEPDKHKTTVLEILYEVGFNSKSSFNTAFKKHTGTTPTNYRKSNS